MSTRGSPIVTCGFCSRLIARWHRWGRLRCSGSSPLAVALRQTGRSGSGTTLRHAGPDRAGGSASDKPARSCRTGYRRRGIPARRSQAGGRIGRASPVRANRRVTVAHATPTADGQQRSPRPAPLRPSRFRRNLVLPLLSPHRTPSTNLRQRHQDPGRAQRAQLAAPESRLKQTEQEYGRQPQGIAPPPPGSRLGRGTQTAGQNGQGIQPHQQRITQAGAGQVSHAIHGPRQGHRTPALRASPSAAPICPAHSVNRPVGQVQRQNQRRRIRISSRTGNAASVRTLTECRAAAELKATKGLTAVGIAASRRHGTCGQSKTAVTNSAAHREMRPQPTTAPAVRRHSRKKTPSPRYSGERAGVRGGIANAELIFRPFRGRGSRSASS